MLTMLFAQNAEEMAAPKEGDLYKVLHAFGRAFELRYGYYEEFERTRFSEPMPIYPDFLTDPVYADDGRPFVTGMQDACRHYCGKEKTDQVCAGCIYYIRGEEFIGLCGCEENRQEHTGGEVK